MNYPPINSRAWVQILADPCVFLMNLKIVPQNRFKIFQGWLVEFTCDNWKHSSSWASNWISIYINLVISSIPIRVSKLLNFRDRTLTRYTQHVKKVGMFLFFEKSIQLKFLMYNPSLFEISVWSLTKLAIFFLHFNVLEVPYSRCQRHACRMSTLHEEIYKQLWAMTVEILY